MAIELHQLTAAFYLIAGLAGLAGLAMPRARFGRAAPWLLAAGALVHGVAFAWLHTLPHPPLLTHLPSAVSLMGWLAAIASLVLLRRGRLAAVAALVAPLAFLAVFFASVSYRDLEPTPPADAGSWPHLHVIFASAGLALLGVAGIAGVLFLAADRGLKAKRPWRSRLPSLEALDRANSMALAGGFPLLSCGVVAGMLWTQGETGALWVGGAHAIWSIVAWAIYLALVVARFVAGWRGREAAASAALGFAFLLFVVIGVGAVA
ncbi:MAG: hypothetical protein DCC71_08375 [Proteobacteria bacterium]|nr:MAG: hypothetical protein DCC71_08375 [Pseudomonadota bacterium]